jgi:hypothetical protein
MRVTLIILALLFFISSSAQVKKLLAETDIRNVTVFSSGARVERAQVNIQAGRTEIAFTGLSNQLEQQTQLKADANITLLSVQSNKDYLSVRKLSRRKEFDRTIKRL